jgi:uncharacterized GH25 family protein
MKRAALWLALAIPATSANAHDFWIAPEIYVAKGKAAEIKATFRVGNAAAPEDWATKVERIVALRSISAEGVVDQQLALVPGQPGSVTLRFARAGSHIVTLESTPAEITLSPKEFNEYLDHEGLSTIREWRTKNGQSDQPGRELYARRAKAIIQIGKRISKHVTRPVGLSLEIVPERNPHDLKAGEMLPVRLYFRGKPLAGAILNCEALQPLGEPVTAQTDSEGRARFAVTRTGSWKIATVYSVPISGNLRADFDTLFASLTFGY